MYTLDKCVRGREQRWFAEQTFARGLVSQESGALIQGLQSLWVVWGPPRTQDLKESDKNIKTGRLDSTQTDWIHRVWIPGTCIISQAPQMAAVQHLVGKCSPKALLCLQRFPEQPPGDRGLALRAPKRHRMIHFHGCENVEINTPCQTQGVLGTSQRRMLGEEGSRRWEGISGRGGRRQGPLVGWLVGWLFFWWGRGSGRRSSSGTCQTLPRPQLSPGLKDRRQIIKELDTFYSTTSNLHLPQSGTNTLANPLTQASAVQQNFLQWWEHLSPWCPVQ